MIASTAEHERDLRLDLTMTTIVACCSAGSCDHDQRELNSSPPGFITVWSCEHLGLSPDIHIHRSGRTYNTVPLWDASVTCLAST